MGPVRRARFGLVVNAPHLQGIHLAMLVSHFNGDELVLKDARVVEDVCQTRPAFGVECYCRRRPRLVARGRIVVVNVDGRR